MWTDINPLTYLFTIPNLDASRHQWMASLANFNFTIEYQHGKNNAAADALSQVNESLFCNDGGFLSVKDTFSETGYPAFY